MKIRYESFGGIIATDDPPACIFVDKNFLLNLNQKKSLLWDRNNNNVLSAPIEAHYAITNYCTANCPGCYMSSKDKSDLLLNDKSHFQRAKKIASLLSDMNIFHVALGGGESFHISWFIKLAEYFRSLNIIPNVTTSGSSITDEVINKCHIFGQINLSMDDIRDDFSISRPGLSFLYTVNVIRRLKEKNIRVGINCVISQKNYNSIECIIAYAKKMRLIDIEFLRFKPIGRGQNNYSKMALTLEQSINLFPKLRRLARKYRIRIKLDCSFTPFICYHRPSKRVLEFFATSGCYAGDWLIGISPSGIVSPCSFIQGEITIENLKSHWDKKETFKTFRFWDKNTDSICKKCDYLSICKGGCHAVSHFYSGSYEEPDPECPFIKKNNFNN